MFAGPQRSPADIRQREPKAADWTERFGFTLLITSVLNAVKAKQTDQRLQQSLFSLVKRIRMACHSSGSRSAGALLKKSFRELRCPQSGENTTLNKTANKCPA